MRKAIPLAMIMALTPLLCAAQAKTYYRVIETDSVGKNALFISINEWFATHYNSANAVIQMADKDAGIIIGKGAFEYTRSGFMQCYTGSVSYTIKVEMKDNRYRVELTNFIHKSFHPTTTSCELGLLTNAEVFSDTGMNKGHQNKVWADLKLKTFGYSVRTFDSLQAHTTNLDTSASPDDW